MSPNGLKEYKKMPTTKLKFSDLKGLWTDKVQAHPIPGTDEEVLCLTDGENNLLAHREKCNSVRFERTGASEEDGILSALEEHLGLCLTNWSKRSV